MAAAGGIDVNADPPNRNPNTAIEPDPVDTTNEPRCPEIDGNRSVTANACFVPGVIVIVADPNDPPDSSFAVSVMVPFDAPLYQMATAVVNVDSSNVNCAFVPVELANGTTAS